MENSQRENALDLEPGSRGRGGSRKNSDGTEETLNVKRLKDEAPRLLKRLRKATDAMQEVREDAKKVCEANGANTAQFMRLLKSSLNGNYEDQRRRAEQQAIIFESVGEVSDAGQ